LELQKAVDDERFEDAAKLRDEIQKLKHEQDENKN
jgi:protein-arginine kinase activator protein McsA